MSSYMNSDNSQAHLSPDLDWVIVDMDRYSQHRPPQHNSRNISSAQEAASSNGYNAAATREMTRLFDNMGLDFPMEGTEHAVAPSDRITSSNDSTVRSDTGERVQAKPVHETQQPPPALSPGLTATTLALHHRHMPSYSPGHIAGWVAGATLPYSLLPPKGPSNPGSLAPEGRSKTGGSSVADTRVVTYPCHGARDGILEVIAAAGAWSNDLVHHARIDDAEMLAFDNTLVG